MEQLKTHMLIKNQEQKVKQLEQLISVASQVQQTKDCGIPVFMMTNGYLPADVKYPASTVASAGSATMLKSIA